MGLSVGQKCKSGRNQRKFKHWNSRQRRGSERIRKPDCFFKVLRTELEDQYKDGASLCYLEYRDCIFMLDASGLDQDEITRIYTEWIK